MARNEEKQYGRLNRLLLQQQKEEDLKKNPPRPKLGSLNCVKEIKRWLPSIIADIDFNLKQSQVPCYPERKISEYRSEVDRLQREYKAFVRKLKELDPGCEVVPWTDRAYSAKKRPIEDHSAAGESSVPAVKRKSDTESKVCENSHSTDTVQQPVMPALQFSDRIALPVLDCETEQEYAREAAEQAPLIWNSDPERQDQPLTFLPLFTKSSEANSECKCGLQLKTKEQRFCGKCDPKSEANEQRQLKLNTRDPQSGTNVQLTQIKQSGTLNLLGIDYDFSDDTDTDSS